MSEKDLSSGDGVLIDELSILPVQVF